jgi:hypothetical protein
LDTNVISEAFRLPPQGSVRAWFDAQSVTDLYLCTPVLAELHFGVERLPAGARRFALEKLVWHIEENLFSERILSVDRSAAQQFGRLVAKRRRVGRPILTMDALIAAVAMSHGMRLATRDLSDFEGLDLQLIDPSVTA